MRRRSLVPLLDKRLTASCLDLRDLCIEGIEMGLSSIQFDLDTFRQRHASPFSSRAKTVRRPPTLNVEDLDLDDRSGLAIGKSGHAERVFWATGTARLLPQLLNGRTSGPVFLTDRRPRRPMALADTDPTNGRVRLSYRRAAELFAEVSGGWTLHQLRHSRLTHLAEDNVDVSLLKAKSRHASLRSLERYVRPSDDAVSRLTAGHDREARRTSR